MVNTRTITNPGLPLGPLLLNICGQSSKSFLRTLDFKHVHRILLPAQLQIEMQLFSMKLIHWWLFRTTSLNFISSQSKSDVEMSITSLYLRTMKKMCRPNFPSNHHHCRSRNPPPLPQRECIPLSLLFSSLWVFCISWIKAINWYWLCLCSLVRLACGTSRGRGTDLDSGRWEYDRRGQYHRLFPPARRRQLRRYCLLQLYVYHLVMGFSALY